MENKINIGDYVTQESIVKNNAIFEVIFFEESLDRLVVKIVFPKYLALQLKEKNVFSIKRSSYSIKSLGNPSINLGLKVLYG